MVPVLSQESSSVRVRVAAINQEEKCKVQILYLWPYHSDMWLGTPKEISAEILKCCELQSPGNLPVFIDITPEPSALKAECFDNARQVAARDGGKLQTGWAIWEWPGVFFELEHHGVHVNDKGVFRDVTPQTNPRTKRTLFLPDDAATYDFKSDHRKNNIRVALSDDSLVKQKFELHDAKYALLEKYPLHIQEVSPEDTPILCDLERRLAKNEIRLLTKFEGDKPCPCGKKPELGLEFEYCCLPKLKARVRELYG